MPEAIRKLFLALIAQLPVGVGLWAKPDFVQQRPLLSASIGVGYEVAVFGGAFLKKVWEDELKKDAVKATADWTRNLVKNSKPGFRRDYFKQVIREYGMFNVRGLGLINTFNLKLDQVFVDLRIAPSLNPAKANANPIAQQLSTQNLKDKGQIWDFLRTHKRNSGEATALAIIGAPGCGKTTLMQHLALVMAGNRQRKYRLRSYIPVLLFLRDHVAAITENPTLKLGTLAQNHLTKQFPKLKPSPDWFERQLENGKCLVLLDGLDEVADKEKRLAISQWVDDQIRNYTGCPFVITSRLQGYRDAPLQRANIVIEVQGFDSQQVKSFVNNWYLANEVVASGNAAAKKPVTEEIQEQATKGADDLLQRLRNQPSLSALTVNPLLLTMIAMVHRYHGALPGSRSELYNEICEVLLGRWRQARGVKDALTSAQKRAVLQPLAAVMMKNGIKQIPAAEAAKIICTMLPSVGMTESDAPSALKSFQASSGLLQEREEGIWSFAHLTFQEFLTAEHWLEHPEAKPDWNEIVDDSWWHETLRLYAAKSDATWIVKACLINGGVAALTLASECLEEAKQIDQKTKDDVNARLIDGLESDVPELRQLAAQVKLSRRLKSLQRIDDNREIDLDFLHCAEYQLFLDQMRANGQYHQPDHWTDFTFAKGQAKDPVLGMRAEDAEAFCEWLTRLPQKPGEEVVYRLPQMDEVTIIKSSQTEFGTWGTMNSYRQLLGMNEPAKKKIADQLSIVSKYGVPFVKEIISDSDRARDRARDRAHARALARAFDLGFDRDRDRDRVLALDLDLDLDSAHARARALDLDLDLDRDHALDLARVLDLARAYNEFDKVCELIVSKQQREARQAVVVLKDSSTIFVSRRAHLIDALLGMRLATDLPQYRLASRQYAAQIFAYAYQGYDLLKSEGRIWSQKMRGAKSDYDTSQQIVLQAYWWMQILLLREEGKLPAWEGIRIVRERKQA